MTFSMVEDGRTVGRLRDSPLRLALVQARTTPVLAVEQPLEVSRLLACVGDDWQLTDRQANREVSVSLGPGGVSQQAGAPETVWLLTSADGSTRAAVSASSVTVESDRYDAWERFYGRVADIFVAVAETFAPARCTRLGVRYVNELSGEQVGADPEQLGEVVNPALIAPALALGRPVHASLSELRVDEGDGAVLTLRHGLVAPATYLLDMDAYRENARRFEPGALTALVDRFHARIEAVFAWALTNAYLATLRGEDAGEALG